MSEEWEGDSPEEVQTVPSAGEQLRLARESKGMSLAQVSAETRINERHLELIEAGDMSALPGRTYAIGFARTFARAVGLDEGTIAETVKYELDTSEKPERPFQDNFEPGDPARVPSRRLGWFAALALIILAAGLIAFFSRSSGYAELDPIGSEEEQAQEVAAAQQGATPAAQPTGGPVVFTALEDDMWIRFYEADGERLFEGQMAQDESFTVPADAENPQVLTGRPDAFGITIGGREVPKLSETLVTVADVPVSAEALLARDASPDASEQQDGEEAGQ